MWGGRAVGKIVVGYRHLRVEAAQVAIVFEFREKSVKTCSIK